MSSNIQQILKIYNTKPKKPRKGRKLKPAATSLTPMPQNMKRTHSFERTPDLESTHRRLRSLDPTIRRYLDEYRNYSSSDLLARSSLDSSLDDGLARLQELVYKSNKVRTSRLNVQMQVLQLGVSELVNNGKLESIAELDDLSFEDFSRPLPDTLNPADTLLSKYEWECEEKLRKK